MQLAELQRIKQWQVDHRDTHPVEYHAWDAALTAWVMGWVGLIPSYAFDALWATPLCLLGMAAPALYCAGRSALHRRGRMRCDWLDRDALLARRPDVRR